MKHIVKFNELKQSTYDKVIGMDRDDMRASRMKSTASTLKNKHYGGTLTLRIKNKSDLYEISVLAPVETKDTQGLGAEYSMAERGHYSKTFVFKCNKIISMNGRNIENSKVHPEQQHAIPLRINEIIIRLLDTMPTPAPYIVTGPGVNPRRTMPEDKPLQNTKQVEAFVELQDIFVSKDKFIQCFFDRKSANWIAKTLGISANQIPQL